LARLLVLSIEEQFYLLYPFLLRRLRLRTRILAALAFVVLLGTAARWLGVALHPQVVEWSAYNSLGCFDQIALGCLLAFLARSRAPRRPLRRGAMVATGAALMIFTCAKVPCYSTPGRIVGRCCSTEASSFCSWGDWTSIFRACCGLSACPES